MKKNKFYGNTMLFITALIWGSAFVAQSVGMDYVKPFTFTAVRSLIGGITLIPVIFLMDLLRKREGGTKKAGSRRDLMIGGVSCGIVLFVASSFQQVGMSLGTPPGKAGFITALYILVVPIIGLILKKPVRPILWLCVAASILGLYLLCTDGGLGSITTGDFLVFICAFCFAAHIQIIDYFSPKVDGVRMSCIQFFICGIISFFVMLFTENPSMEALLAAKTSILYAGVMSSGVAYTMQILGQKHTSPTVASLIMSLESVFAVLAGIVILHQIPSLRDILGCIIMFTAIIVAQLPEKKSTEAPLVQKPQA
ncbi:MAG: DMT family transporter [Oscillospiraceae bacterium]